MLREIARVKQDTGGMRRRWFHSDYFDLFIWESIAGEIGQFQLCYDLGRDERALVWKTGVGFFHDGVDAREDKPGRAMSALFVANGAFPAQPVRERLRREAGELPDTLLNFVIEKLDEYAPLALLSRPCRRRVRRESWQQRDA